MKQHSRWSFSFVPPAGITPKFPVLCYNGGQSRGKYPLLALKSMNKIFPWSLQPGYSEKNLSHTWVMDLGWVKVGSNHHTRIMDLRHLPLSSCTSTPAPQGTQQHCGITAVKPLWAGMASHMFALAHWFSIQNLEFIEDSSFVTSSIRDRHHRDGRGKKN